MTFRIELDMEAIRKQMRKHLQGLIDQGYELPYLKDGEVGFTCSLSPESPSESPNADDANLKCDNNDNSSQFCFNGFSYSIVRLPGEGRDGLFVDFLQAH